MQRLAFLCWHYNIEKPGSSVMSLTQSRLIYSNRTVKHSINSMNILVTLGLHCSCLRWSVENELFGDKRLFKYLNNIEKQYQTVLDQVTAHGGTESLHKNLARLKSLVSLAQQRKQLEQVRMCKEYCYG